MELAYKNEEVLQHPGAEVCSMSNAIGSAQGGLAAFGGRGAMGGHQAQTFGVLAKSSSEILQNSIGLLRVSSRHGIGRQAADAIFQTTRSGEGRKEAAK
jgi:hypothetical protein